MDESSRIRLLGADHRQVIVKDKGHASATVLFDHGMPFQGQGIIPALNGNAEEVMRTVEAFELLMGSNPQFDIEGRKVIPFSVAHMLH